MKPADEYHEIRDGLYCWQAYDRSVKADLSSTAARTGAGLLFIDPIPLATAPLAGMTGGVKPLAILLTNANHQRAAAEYRENFGIPVWAHPDAAGFSVEVDRRLEDGATPLDDFKIIHLPGVVAGEIAMYSPQAGGTMMMGDALIHLEPGGFAFLPDRYCQEPKLARASLQKLLHFSFDLMTFAHGTPIVSRARKRLQELFP